jgi:enoyl-[acyl-carrier protein] reductase/trans-2-enoyl-CoA reductase (NAD+)
LEAFFTNKTVDFHSGKVSEISIQPCTDEDIENTVAVMGGEDWSMWIDSLKEKFIGSRSNNSSLLIGPSLTEAVYRKAGLKIILRLVLLASLTA